MTSSESINFSKYSMINELNTTMSTNLDMIDQKNNNQEKPLNELTQVLLQDKEEKESHNNDEIGKKNNNIDLKENSDQNTNEKQENNQNLLYGNPIGILNPKVLGKSYAFLYDDRGNPRLTIGPNCKCYLINFYLR